MWYRIFTGVWIYSYSYNFLMFYSRSALYDLALLEHEDLVGVDYCRESMCYDDRGTVFTDHVQRGLDVTLRLRVQRRGGLEDDNVNLK